MADFTPTGLTLKFSYDEKERIVDDVTIEDETETIIGMEREKDGEYTHKIKRYSMAKIFDLERIW